MTPYGCINVHASLLPKYRGAAPIQWAVINGEKVSGVTTMQMDEGLDTGDMLEKVEITLDKKETGGSLFNKLSAKGAALCVHTLAELEKGTITPQKQGESTTEYAKMLNKKSGEIDWTKTAVEIERLIRGLNPWPSAYTQWEGKTMKIWEAEVEDVVETIDTHEPGTITEVTKHGFKVQTGKGRLAIKSLQIPGKKRMEADAFLRGYHIFFDLTYLAQKNAKRFSRPFAHLSHRAPHDRTNSRHPLKNVAWKRKIFAKQVIENAGT